MTNVGKYSYTPQRLYIEHLKSKLALRNGAPFTTAVNRPSGSPRRAAAAESQNRPLWSACRSHKAIRRARNCKVWLTGVMSYLVKRTCPALRKTRLAKFYRSSHLSAIGPTLSTCLVGLRHSLV